MAIYIDIQKFTSIKFKKLKRLGLEIFELKADAAMKMKLM